MRGATLAVVLSLAAASAHGACREDVVELRGDFGTARFSVDVADTDAERGRGLMNVPKMAASRGMLFVYEQPQRATFWMKNTLIPLDMIFMDPSGTVTHVHEKAIPHDETTIDGGAGVLFVLEINGGLASRIGIDVGAELRHPAIDQSRAAWPCE